MVDILPQLNIDKSEILIICPNPIAEAAQQSLGSLSTQPVVRKYY